MEIGCGFLGPVQIIQNKAAIDIGGDNVRIAPNRLSELRERQLRLLVVLVHIASEQRNIALFGQYILILRDQRQQLVVLFQVQQVVAEINDDLAILGQHLDGSASNLRGFLVLAREVEIALLLAHDGWDGRHILPDSVYPGPG